MKGALVARFLRRCGPVARGESGEVFIEALIAAAIVAMALGTTYQVMADSTARDRKAENVRRALLIAQSEMAAVGSEIPLESGRTDGLAGDLMWRAEVSPYAAEGNADAAGALWKVSVSVRPRAGGPNLVALTSLRLAGGA